MSYEIDWIDGPDALAALEPEWDRLAAFAGVPFVTPAWILSWWHAFGTGGRLRVLVCRRHGELVAALPLVRRAGLFTSPTNAHTPVFFPVGPPDAVRALADAAHREAVGSFVVTHLPSRHPATESLVGAARASGRLTWLEPGQTSPVVDTARSADDYRRALPRDTRRELGRLRRKLDALGAVVSPLREPVDLDAELGQGLRLEASGWKARRGTAILSSPRATAFYRAIAEAFARRGELRLSTITVAGRPIAFDLCLVACSRLWIPKGAYDEAHRAQAPGLVLLLAEIEHACELGLEAVELLGDAEPYKRKFATELRSHCSVHSHRRRPVPLARLGYRRVARPVLRDVYRRVHRRR